MSTPNTTPTPYATHADLNILRREIQSDVRHEVRDITREMRESIKELNAAQVTSKQFLWTTGLAVFNAGMVAYYMLVGK